MINITLDRQGKNISFDIDPALRTVILGENGIGKSTVLKSISEKSATENWLSVKVSAKMKILYFSQVEKTDLPISGGEHTRLRLEKLFSTSADLYVLDEPTNNLDQDNIKWLKDYVLQKKIQLIFTSHNIDFIEEVAEVMFYLDSKSVEKTQKKCSEYLADRKQRIEREFSDYKINQRTHERLVGSVKLAQAEFEAGIKWKNEDKGLQGFKREMAGKFGGATVKRLSKRAEQFEVKEPDSDPIPNVRLHSGNKLSHLIDFNGAMISGKRISFSLSSGDKLIICGKNGIGKTMLIEKIVGYLNGAPISRGDDFQKIGRIKYFYLSQNWYEKIEKEKVDDYLMKVFSNRQDIYRALSYNYLAPEILDKNFADLSPGIRIKVMLGVLSLNHFDLIIWDEPTNHLDVMTQYVLQQALTSYDGALIIVTHDVKILNDGNFLKIES